MYSLFEGLFGWIQSMGTHAFTNLYLIIQFIIFLTLAIVLSFLITKEIRTMQKVKKEIEGLDNRSKNIDQQLQKIFNEVHKSRFKELWDRYYKRVKNKEEDEKIKVDDFFSDDVLYHHMGYRSWMDMGSGLFVSIGVLGTFIGLSVGLTELNVGDSDALRTGIGSLIDGMKVAFYTSVWGVFLSLVWTFFDRIIGQKLEKEIDWHAERLNYLLNTEDEEIFLNRLEKLTRNQTDQLKTVLTDVMEKAMQSMVSQVQQSHAQVQNAFTQLNHQFEKINNGIDTQAKLLQSQLELTQNNSLDMTDKLVDQITGGTEKSLTQFSQLIEETANMQKYMMGTINQVVDSFSAIQKHQNETSEKTEKMFSRFDTMSNKLEAMGGYYEQASSYIANLSEQIQAVQNLTIEQLPVQQDVLKSNQLLAQKYENITEGFKEFNEKIEEKHYQIIEQVTTVLETMAENYKAMTVEFKNALKVQANTLNESYTLLQNVQEAVTNLLPVAPNLREVVGNIDMLRTQLEQTQQLQQDILPELVSMRQDTNTTVQEALTATRTYVDEITEQVKTLQSHWNTTKEQFVATRETLDNSVKDFGENIDNGLSKTFEHVDNTLTKAVSLVSNLVNQFSEAQSELLEGLEDLGDKIAKSKPKEVVQR
jgi:methyl-accepting chemotaxis protein